MKVNQQWKEIYITKNNLELFCNHFFTDNDCPNIVYVQSPVGSVVDFKRSYEALSGYGFNIFAIDLTSIGRSIGEVGNFTLKGVVKDLDACIEYIRARYHGAIHLFGGTGIGGILGQYYASTTDKISSFAQYGVGIYGDTSIVSFPTWMLKIAYPMMKLFAKMMPKLTLNMKPPKYSGFNADLDNSFYEMMLKEVPNMFKSRISILVALVGMFLERDSALKLLPKCPTLVFETLHDRYFPINYFEDYFNMLTCEKKLYTIDDVHNSHYFHSEEICKEVAHWFADHS